MIIRGPHPPPHEHKQPLCGYTEPLCRSIQRKTVLENNFQGPMFIRDPTLSQHKQPVCEHMEPLCGSIHLKNLLKYNFQAPMFISDSLPPTHEHKQSLCG